MECFICGRYITRDYDFTTTKVMCSFCEKEQMEFEIREAAKFSCLGHTIECSAKMALGRICSCGKWKYHNGKRSHMIKKKPKKALI